MGVRWSKSSLHFALLAICAICIAPVMTPLTHVIPNVISECLIATEVISVNFPSTEPIYKCMDFHNYMYEIFPCPCLHVNEPRFKVSLLWAEMGSWSMNTHGLLLAIYTMCAKFCNNCGIAKERASIVQSRPHQDSCSTIATLHYWMGQMFVSYASYRWTHLLRDHT